MLKRAIESVLKKEVLHILKPIIDRQLLLAGSYGKYKIITTPVTFEDATKLSKRGLGEIEAGVKARRSYHEENNQERSWEEEKKRIEEDAAWTQNLFNKYPAYFQRKYPGKGDAKTGTQGSEKPVEEQQERRVPGNKGSDVRDDE